jgi:hypothetical protein
VSLLDDLLRPFWLSGLNDVSGKQTGGVGTWLLGRDYQVYVPLIPDGATLSFTVPDPLLAAFASDVASMSAAAFETLDGIQQSTRLPKSVGWLLTRTYYAAFFAAHAVLRMLGRSCTNLETGHMAAIHAIADAYGNRAGISLTRGQYGILVSNTHREVSLQKRAGTDGGSHGAMWSMFSQLLSDLISALLPAGRISVPAQQVAAKLTELQQALTFSGGMQGGNWLSHVRNKANYQLAFGAWFPYAERERYYEQLFRVGARWIEDPMSLPVWAQSGRDLQRFMEACTLIVAICRSLSEDMSRRCSAGKSFHRYAGMALMSQVAIRDRV